MPASTFLTRLRDLGDGGDARERRWLFVPYDQLSDELGPLAREPAEELGIVLVESRHKAGRRAYHKQKLALVLTNLRHFALEQAARGVAVRYLAGDAGYADALASVTDELGMLRMMEAAELELREELQPLVAAGQLEVLPHEGWLTSADDFAQACGDDPPWRMDSFYRHVRRRTGLLMRDGEPEGGKFSFDAENRKPWKGEPPAPEPPRFEPDAITREVCELVERVFAEHPGRLDPSTLPASRDDAERLWRFGLEQCLPHFGPYEDAMSEASRGLFHTRLSAVLNLHRVTPRRVVDDVARCDAPLASREGFVRQVLGWREFVRHVHARTHGFRELPQNVLGADAPLPPAYWGTPSGLRCLDRTVQAVLDEGYSHHITRLMVLGNLATLLGYDPRELSDWFWVMYVDAYDWVVEPNVLGMATFALGQLFTTKPYVSGAAYISRMSDHCGSCAFHPRRDCPITRLYWAFLARHADTLEDTARMGMPLRSAAKRAPAERERDAAVFRAVREALAAGATLDPSDFAD